MSNVSKKVKGVIRENLQCEATKSTYDFRRFNMIKCFERIISNGDIALGEADYERRELTDYYNDFCSYTNQKT